MSKLAEEIAKEIETFLFDGGAEVSKLQYQNFVALIDQKLSGTQSTAYSIMHLAEGSAEWKLKRIAELAAQLYESLKVEGDTGKE